MKGFALASMAFVLILAVAMVGLYDLGIQITGLAIGPGWAEMTIQACAAESNTNKGVFNSACDGTYPSACGVAGDLLSCNDSFSESHQTDGSCPACYTGLRITLYNSSVTDCSAIQSVSVCYEWWGDGGLSPTDCDISVDNRNNTNFTAATTTCPGTTADPGVTCTNVTGLKNWTCSNFFGASGNRSNIKSELRRSAGGNKQVYWDVLFYNVTYSIAADATAPQWSNNKTFPTSPATYSSVQSYQFNVTWIDNVAVSAVRFEHNFTGTPANYSASGNAGSEYYYNYGPLAAGAYYWKSHANDTSNISNSTPQFVFVVDKATATLTLTVSPSNNVTYVTTTNASCTASTAQIVPQLYRNGTPVLNPDVQTLAAGTYNYTCNASATQNYTAPAQVSQILTVNRVASACPLTFVPTSPQTYGTPVTASCSCTNPEATAMLYRNLTDVTATENGTAITLPAGTWFYNCTAVQTQNYTYAENTSTYAINKAISVVNLTLDGIDGNITVSTNQSVNITGYVVVPAAGYIELYDNGTLINSGQSPLTNITNYSSAGLHNITIVYNATQNYTPSYETHFIDVTTGDVSPPTVTFISPTPSNATVQSQTWIYVNVTVTDTQSSIDACTLQFDGNNFTMTRVGSGLSVSCFRNHTGIANGVYIYRVSANDSATNTGVSETRTIMIDTASPQWSNNKTYPTSPATYSPVQSYQFNITWTDNVAVSTVRFEHNFTGTPANYSPSGSSGSEYYYNYGLLAVGAYYWRSHANDTVNNRNATSQFDYVASKVSTMTELRLNGVRNNLTVTYPTQVNATANTSALTVTLYRNGTPVASGNPAIEVATLAAGTHNYTAINAGNENYTGSSEMWFLTIQQNTSTCSLTFVPASPQTYGTLVTASCSCTNPESSTRLFRNGTDVTAIENGTATILPAGTWNYVCNVSASQNRTAASNSSSYIVNKAASTLTLTAIPSWNVTYGNTTNISCTASTAQITPQLYRNGTPVLNPDVQTLAAGLYNYTCNASATQNYTAPAQVSQILTVNRVASACPLTFVPISPQTYGTTVNASCSCTNPETSAMLYRNGTDVTTTENNVFTLLPAGTWSYNCTVAATQNYTYAENTSTYIINKAPTGLTLASSSWSVPNGTQTNVSCYANISSVNISLYRNSTLVGSSVGGTVSDVQTLAAGSYNYTCNTTGNQNYTAASQSNTLLVSVKTITNCYLSFDPVSGQTYPVSVNASCSCTNSQASAQLWRDNANVTSENNIPTSLAAGSHTYACNVTETSNYTSGSNSSIYVINNASTITNLTLNGAEQNLSLTYPQTVTAVFWTSALTAILFRNYTDVSAENNTPVILAVGYYNYTAINYGNQNYTGSSKMFFVTVNKATPVLNLTSSPSWSETYGTQTTVNCTASTAQITPQLYRNGTLVSSSDVQTLAAGNYNYTCNASATQNYTAPVEISQLLTISQAGTTTQLYLNGSRSNITLGYSIPLNITAITSALTLSLFINGVLSVIGNAISSLFTFAAGLYNITAINYGNANYTGSSEAWFANVLRENSSCSLIFNPPAGQTYPGTVNASCSCTNPEDSAALYRNGSDVTAAENNNNITLAAGDWSYNCTVAQTQNYTYAENATTYTINKTASTLTLVASPPWSATYGTPTNVSCTASTPQITPQLYRNGTFVFNADVQTLGAGAYGYVCNATETQNYTAPASQSNTLTVDKAASSVNLTLNGVDGDIAAFTNQAVNLTGYIIVPSIGYIELYDNGTLINAGNSPLTNTTSYAIPGLRNITVVYNATQNYTASYETHFTNVTVFDITSPTVNLVSPTPSNGTLQNHNWTYVNATAADTQSNITACTLQFNGANYGMTLVGSGLSISCYRNHTIADGTYSYKVYANESSNNTGVSETRTITIDTTPLAGVTNLGETAYNETWIYWAWTNPADADFNHTKIWINGTSYGNVYKPTNYYNATGLVPNTTYQIQTRTADHAGNINTTWVNDIATTAPSTDTTSPLIYNVHNGSVTNSTALIAWNTDDFGNSTVLYGTSPANMSITASNSSFVQNHTILLDLLLPNTTYYYNISSCSAGGCNASGIYNFTTVANVTLLPDGLACTTPSDCIGGFCVHNVCRSTATYCSDSYCDAGEDCSSCSVDCGTCLPSGGGGGGGGGGPPPVVTKPVLGEGTGGTIEHAELGHIIGDITATAGVAAHINPSIVDTPVSEIVIMPKVDITDARIEITKLDVTSLDGRYDMTSLHTTEFAITPTRYSSEFGEVVYGAFSVNYAGLEGKISEVLFTFNVGKSWVEESAIDPNTVVMYRQVAASGEWELVDTYLIGENATSYQYTSISPGLSTFAIVATSPPLLCSLCRSGDWSTCADGEQTRLAQDCGAHTGYTCRPIVESRSCEVPAVPSPPGLPLDIIIVPIIGVAIGSYIIFGYKGATAKTKQR